MAGDLTEYGMGMVETLGNLSTIAIGAGGKIVVAELFKGYVNELRHKFRRAKAEKKISEEFERSRHGQSLLQEALNALWTVRDQERAEAIQRVFLGLAMNPVTESLAQIEQLQILQLVAEMSAWEVMLFNALERYSKVAFQPDLAQSHGPWEDASRPDVARTTLTELQGLIQARVPRFGKWLTEDYCENNKAAFIYLRNAVDSLNKKMLLKVPYSGIEETQTWSALDRKGPFTEFGWKLAQHLYSAEVPTEVEKV